jgi:GntR family transcriptional repressor for pyruvate dehydrogenase complex
MKFKNIQNQKVHTAIIEQVCDAILVGELKKGDLLPSERDISLQSGLSRSSVRKAIQAMAEAGLVSTTPGWSGGTKIKSIAILDLLGGEIGSEPESLIEFYETRNILELAAAELAAKRATPELIAKLEETVEDMQILLQSHPDDSEKHFAIDSRFHRLVFECTNNKLLFELYIPVLRKLWLVNSFLDVKEFHSYDLTSMRAFVQAIKDRDSEAAHDAMGTHVKPLLEIMLKSKDGAIKTKK